MSLKVIHAVSFSPTATSRKISDAIARGVALATLPIRRHNLTRQARELILGAHDLAVIAVPVYGGHVPPIALERLAKISGNQTPAVLVVVYGNRAFEHAMEDLHQYAVDHGFVPIAEAAFVGEHSYSTSEFPIAPSRPDREDLIAASSFGQEVYHKVASGDLKVVDPQHLHDIPLPMSELQAFVGAITASKQAFRGTMLPITDPERCTHCGTCSAMCPTSAIRPGDELHTDPQRCIHCCACVKVCPESARSLENPYAAPLSAYFAKRKQPICIFE